MLTVVEAKKSGHPDENHTAEALRLGRVLITCDRDYLNERRFRNQLSGTWSKFDARRNEWTWYARFLDGTTSRDRFRWSRGKLQTWVEH